MAVNETVQMIDGCLRPTNNPKLYSMAESLHQKSECSMAERTKKVSDGRHRMFAPRRFPQQL